MNKYRAKKTVSHGITFDSRAEARRYDELLILARTGEVTNIRRQVPFLLAPAVKLQGRTKPAIKYIADFCYDSWGKPVVEEVKGAITPVFRIKQHLMATVHGIHLNIVR